MSWTYDASNLDTATAAGRLNVVRLLLGDTNTLDQQTQDEEITFALSENANNVYRTASWLARTLASKYARYVDIELDGQLSEKYSQLHKHYSILADHLSDQARENGSIGVAAGGLSIQDMRAVRSNTDRPKAFYIGQYDNGDRLEDEYL